MTSQSDRSDLASSLAFVRLEVLHKETREELDKADGKATTLTSIVGLILGIFLAGAVAGGFSPKRFSYSLDWLFWIGLGLALAAETALCAAIFPRIKPRTPKELLRYFVHVAEFKTKESFRSALPHVDTEYDRLADQVYDLSRVVVRKYSLIRLGIFTLAAGALCCMASVLLNQYLLSR